MYCTQQTMNDLFWGISTDTVFTVLVPIIIFIAGYFAKQHYEAKKEERRLLNIRDYILTVLDSINEKLPKVINNMQELGEKIGDLAHQNIEFKENSKLFLDSIKTVKEVDYYNALFLDLKRSSKAAQKHFENILNTIEFIRLHRNRVKENFMNYFNRYRDYSNQWGDNLNAIFRLFDKYRSHNEANDISVSKDQFLGQFDKIIHQWRSENENFRKYQIVSEHLLSPLKKLCQDNLSDPRSNELLPIIVHANYALGDIKHLKKSYSEYFTDESQQLADINSNLKEAISYFSQ